ncbi:helix-turn-helix transcriptional regulator [Paenalcaligenes niemegkensis]|uniref:helix-turn-helix transcriptional regulator n=1 Tax=Paenalcaligenes niemegkensis TaxID=2895469 RepID=UPI001EE89651|nr:helix-turn-helix transcriptional regulator [Paenalcaligenes niemegkensis]MCQ9615333.1 helix-turn-helix transcriptional regulator [Paenalcaligenes niemegkensis]
MPRYYPTDTNRAVFDGLLDTMELAPGLILHRVDARDQEAADIHGVVKPGLRIALVIGGKVDVSIGQHRLLLGPQASGGLRGALISVVEPVAFLRQSNHGNVERTVSMTMTPSWLRTHLGLESAGCLEFAQKHLSVSPWSISPQAVTLVEQMLTPPALPPSLWRMYLGARALALAVEALATLEGGAPKQAATRLRKRDRIRMEQLRNFLDSGKADSLSLEEIAQYACVSVNTLQRHFSSVWGVTVVAYLRESRLERARLALEEKRVSVAEAAWLAGYSSPSNFATAFRRRYGIRPGQVGYRLNSL